MYLKLDKKWIKIVNATSFFTRLKGFMWQKKIESGILFPKCNSIHTFFMKSHIDIIGINEKNQVIYLNHDLCKNKIVKIKNNSKKTSILELPQNTVKKVKIGSTLIFKEK